MTWLDIPRTATPEHIVLMRLLLAAVFGGIVGIDRELKQRPAGLRTHILVAMGAALFTLITFELMAHQGQARGDPIRVVEAVTAGVAFLAAGAIIQTRGEVHGITTGASMWLSAALGVACGAGDYTIAAIATILTIFVLAVLTRMERWLGTKQPNHKPPTPGPNDN